MMKFHVFYGSNGKDSSQRCKLGNWCKGLSVIQVRFLRESLGNNPCFVLLNRAICILLNLENPIYYPGGNRLLLLTSIDFSPSKNSIKSYIYNGSSPIEFGCT